MSESIESRVIERLRLDLKAEKEHSDRLRKQNVELHAKVQHFENVVKQVEASAKRAFDKYEQLIKNITDNAIALLTSDTAKAEIEKAFQDRVSDDMTMEEVISDMLRPAVPWNVLQ